MNSGLRELRGRLLPLKDLVEDSDNCLKEDVEEDEGPVFVDAEELCSGGLKAGGLPGRIWGEEAPYPWGMGLEDE